METTCEKNVQIVLVSPPELISCRASSSVAPQLMRRNIPSDDLSIWVYCGNGKMVDWIWMPFGMVGGLGR